MGFTKSFLDEAEIFVAAGHGGPGCVAFRREKYEPRGGPNGGDGGRGGDVMFVASNQLNTLYDFRYKKIFKAENGKPGLGSMCAGQDADTLVVRVPMGMQARDAETGEILHDFEKDGDTWLVCKGGRGGKGNSHFATARFQAPKFAQPGEEGTSIRLKLELKLVADMGLVGFPNAGKSTLISRISAARPKVADYPFTTLIPHLGVVRLGEFRSCVVADIPGLIENAHKGKGLGHRFLKHVERTRVLLHLVNGEAALDGKTVDDRATLLVQTYETIRRELTLFSLNLQHKPEWIAITKADLFEPEEREQILLKFRETLAEKQLETIPFWISSTSGVGIEDLFARLQQEFGLMQPQIRAELRAEMRAEMRAGLAGLRMRGMGADPLDSRDVRIRRAATDA